MGDRKPTARTGRPKRSSAKRPKKSDLGHRTTPEEYAFRLAVFEAVSSYVESRPKAFRRKYGPLVSGNKTMETPHLTLRFDAIKLGKKFSYAFVRPMLHKYDETIEADFYIVARTRNRKSFRLEILKRGTADFNYDPKAGK